MSRNKCANCQKPAPDGALCASCDVYLLRQLRFLLDHAQDLTDSVGKLTAKGKAPVVSQSFAHPMPLNVAAMRVSDDVRTVLVGWSRDIASRGASPARGDSTTALVLHLLHYGRWAGHPEAAEALDEFKWAASEVRRLIDIPMDRVLIGTCECGRIVYAKAGRSTVPCPDCGESLDVAEAREAMLRDLAIRLATLTEMPLALSVYGIDVPGATLRSWATRGRLIPQGRNVGGKPLYRIAQAKALAESRRIRRRK